MKNYEWRGYTWQIADEDLHLYPGAVEVKAKKAPTTKNKKSTTPANKSRQTKTK